MIGTFLLTAATTAAFFRINAGFAIVMLILFAGTGSAAHTDIFDCPAKSRHFMSFKMCQTDEHVRIHNGPADFRFLNILSPAHRNSNIVSSLQTIANQDGATHGQRGEPVFPSAIQMLQRVFTASRIQRIAVG